MKAINYKLNFFNKKDSVNLYDFEKAVNELSEGFAIDETLANIRGLKIVTPDLTYALTQLGRQQEALDYCDRCLKIAPNNSEFLQLKKKIEVAMWMSFSQE